MNVLRRLLQIVLPILVLALGIALAIGIVASRRPPVVVPGTFTGPAVRTVPATAAPLRLDVPSQGSIEPGLAIDLAPQVGGAVLQKAVNLRPGAFCTSGELLLQIDPTDYQLALVQREAAVARAELRLLQEQAEAEAARRAWRELEGERAPEPLVGREPQRKDAEAELAAARAALDKARLDLARTRVVAPFAARVVTATIDQGQTVAAGQTIARLHGIDFVEVRLPIASQDAAFLDLPQLRPGADPATGATVQCTAEFAGQRHTWTGTVVRVEGELDRRTRQLTLVARIDAPYGGTGDQPPLLPGMFVTASITGRTFPEVIALPRAALRGEDTVWVLDAEHRLARRTVVVLRAEAERVLLRSGLSAGELVVVTPLETPTVGMPVVPVADDADPAARRQ